MLSFQTINICTFTEVENIRLVIFQRRAHVFQNYRLLTYKALKKTSLLKIRSKTHSLVVLLDVPSTWWSSSLYIPQSLVRGEIHEIIRNNTTLSSQQNFNSPQNVILKNNFINTLIILIFKCTTTVPLKLLNTIKI